MSEKETYKGMADEQLEEEVVRAMSRCAAEYGMSDVTPSDIAETMVVTGEGTYFRRIDYLPLYLLAIEENM